LNEGKVNTSDFLLENVDNAKVAITMPEQDYSYGELKKAIVQLENELIGFGVKPLDKVAILGSNSFFWIASYLSILRRGGGCRTSFYKFTA
jgi:acyl-coenzyme A synthetase/AMP-(fatty) acid ligase